MFQFLVIRFLGCGGKSADLGRHPYLQQISIFLSRFFVPLADVPCDK